MEAITDSLQSEHTCPTKWVSIRSPKVRGTLCDITFRGLTNPANPTAWFVAATSTSGQVFTGRLTAQTSKISCTRIAPGGRMIDPF